MLAFDADAMASERCWICVCVFLFSSRFRSNIVLLFFSVRYHFPHASVGA